MEAKFCSFSLAVNITKAICKMSEWNIVQRADTTSDILLPGLGGWTSWSSKRTLVKQKTSTDDLIINDMQSAALGMRVQCRQLWWKTGEEMWSRDSESRRLRVASVREEEEFIKPCRERAAWERITRDALATRARVERASTRCWWFSTARCLLLWRVTCLLLLQLMYPWQPQ